MPELPEVETTVRALSAILIGEKISRVTLRRPDLRRLIPVGLSPRMTGATIIKLARRAKYGLIETDQGDTMIFHLGMSGRWRIQPEKLEKHDHLLLETQTGTLLALNDPRRFGSIDLVCTNQINSFPPFQTLGPEPLGVEFSEKILGNALNKRTTAIKSLLLDQRVVAGLGNIYVCEALHRAGIAPTRPGGKVGTQDRIRLVESIQYILIEAIKAGGSTLRDYKQPDGNLGYFFKQWQVYGREGEPCLCGQKIIRRVDRGRSTFYCRKCQSH